MLAPTVALPHIILMGAKLLSLSRFVRSLRELKKTDHYVICLFNKTGNVLFSRAVARQVSSALESLTSVFEMGTGGSSPPLSPDRYSILP